jgi:hypothetical protein
MVPVRVDLGDWFSVSGLLGSLKRGITGEGMPIPSWVPGGLESSFPFGLQGLGAGTVCLISVDREGTKAGKEGLA